MNKTYKIEEFAKLTGYSVNSLQRLDREGKFSTVLDAKAPMVMDRNFKPGFRIDLHIKDLANALDTSHGVGAQLPLTAAVMEMMQALRADGLGTADHSALACCYEKLAKVEITR